MLFIMASLGGVILTGTPQDVSAALNLSEGTAYSLQAINGDAYFEIAASAPSSDSTGASLAIATLPAWNINIPTGEKLYAWTNYESSSVRVVITPRV